MDMQACDIVLDCIGPMDEDTSLLRWVNVVLVGATFVLDEENLTTWNHEQMTSIITTMEEEIQ